VYPFNSSSIRATGAGAPFADLLDAVVPVLFVAVADPVRVEPAALGAAVVVVVLGLFVGIPRFSVGGPLSVDAAAACAAVAEEEVVFAPGAVVAAEAAAVETVGPLLYPASRTRANPCIFASTAARSAASSHGRANSCGSRFAASDTATIWCIDVGSPVIFGRSSSVAPVVEPAGLP
jgi:hypothetical protein